MLQKSRYGLKHFDVPNARSAFAPGNFQCHETLSSSIKCVVIPIAAVAVNGSNLVKNRCGSFGMSSLGEHNMNLTKNQQGYRAPQPWAEFTTQLFESRYCLHLAFRITTCDPV